MQLPTIPKIGPLSKKRKITVAGAGVLNAEEYGMEITTDPTTKNLIYTKVPIFKNIFYQWQNWMPIPQTELDKNPKLVQNPLN